MEQVFFRIHVRALTAYTNLLQPKNRIAFEYGSFICGVLTVALITSLHYYYLSPISNPSRDCLLEQVTQHTRFNSCSNLGNEAVLYEYDVFRFVISSDSNISFSNSSGSIAGGYEYLFSTDRSLLQLALSASAPRVTVTTIPLDPFGGCFGPPLLASLLHRVIGYDTIMSSLLSPVAGTNSTYLTTRYWGRIVDLPSPSSRPPRLLALLNTSVTPSPSVNTSAEAASSPLVFKAMALLTSIFLFFTTSTLVSYTLRETQSRMLHFTHLLQLHTQTRRPIAALIGTHIVESLVFVPILLGMLFFMFEFFAGDRLLAFYVLSLVWMCEVFSVVSLRTVASMRLFSRSYLCYFTLFHLYLLHFPVLGFSHLALLASLLLLGHIMVLCWNRYELPALRSGLVSALQPRGIWVSVLEQDSSINNNDSSVTVVDSTPEVPGASSGGPTPLDEIIALEQQQQRQQMIIAAEQLLQQQHSNSRDAETSLASHVQLSRQIQHAQMQAVHQTQQQTFRNSRQQLNGASTSQLLPPLSPHAGTSTVASSGRSASRDSDSSVIVRTLSSSSNPPSSAAGLTKNTSVNDLGYGRNDFTVFGFGIDDDDMQYYR